MEQPVRLTLSQKLLLADLPDAPSDGIYCKGGRYRTAVRLRDHGLARCVGSGGWVGGYFVRTNAGRAAILDAGGK